MNIGATILAAKLQDKKLERLPASINKNCNIDRLINTYSN